MSDAYLKLHPVKVQLFAREVVVIVVKDVSASTDQSMTGLP
jgi:hypothetical protein